MRLTPSPFPGLSLSGLMLLLAATNACVIVNNGGDGDGDDECVELDEVCPNLVCETGNVVVDGCAICECNAVCDPGPAPECANPVLLEDECRWACGTGSCFSDVDCGPGSICVFPTTETPDEPQQDPPEGGAAPEPVPAPDGVCVVVDTGCFSDADCGAGFFCDFAVDGGGGGAEPPPDDGSNGDRAAPPAPRGTCRERPTECFSDADCREGQVCEIPGFTNALVAPGGVCVDKSECETDADCGQGETCAVECRSDPNCPECDVCVFFGTCIAVETTCFDDAACAEGEFCDLTSGGGAERPCLDANNDNICDDASDPIAPPNGVCRPLEVDPCATVRCESGTCLVTFAGEAVCVADDNRCFADTDCAEGTVCNAGIDICLPPPECDPNTDRPCLAVCSGFCVEAPTTCFADADCADGEVCLFDPTIDQGGSGERPIIAPQGVCGPAPSTCTADTGCGRGEACVNGVCEATTAPVGCEAIRCISGTECVEDAAGNGSCVASIGECASSEECPTGSTCNAGEVCNAPPDCERGQLCADVCYGYCVAN